MSSRDNHPPCPCGDELADECMGRGPRCHRGLSGMLPTPQELANVAAAAAAIQAHADHVNAPGHDVRTCMDPRCHAEHVRAVSR